MAASTSLPGTVVVFLEESVTTNQNDTRSVTLQSSTLEILQMVETEIVEIFSSFLKGEKRSPFMLKKETSSTAFLISQYDWKNLSLLRPNVGLQMISESTTNLPGLGHTFSIIKWKKLYPNHLGCEKGYICPLGKCINKIRFFFWQLRS